MKKILLGVALISVLLLAGCNKNKDTEGNNVPENKDNQQQEATTKNQEDENNNIKQESKELNLMYTSLESLKRDGFIPSTVEVDKYYDIGSVKINTKVYDLKYKKIEDDDEYINEGIIEEHYLSFFENGVEKKSFMISGGYWDAEYYNEISIFKNKYLVCVTETNNGDTLQFIEIFDEELNFVDVGEDSYLGYGYPVHHGYNNYYTINEDNITCIDVGGVIKQINEEKGVFTSTIVGKSDEGVIPVAGRT